MKKIESLQGLRMILFLAIFMYHAATFDVIYESTLHKLFFRGGGLIAVTYFFVLSGFVGALSCEKIKKWNGITYVEFLKKRMKQFYPLNTLFLILSLPLNISLILGDLKESIIKFFYCIMLLQSWNSDKAVWTAYNGVSWFLSTSLFLTICLPILYIIYNKLCKVIINEALLNKTIIVICAIGMCMCAYYTNDECAGYWLYAFPPVRLFDFIGGFCLARLYLMKDQCINTRKNNLLNWGIILIFLGYLVMFPYVKYSYSRACIYFPGALITIWGLATSDSFLERILSTKWMLSLGEGTLYFMLCHQVVLYYFSYVVNKMRLCNPIMGYFILIIILLLIIMSYYILKRIKNVID